MCGMWVVAGLLLLLVWASVLCVWRCAGVRRARAVRACVLESRVRLAAGQHLVQWHCPLTHERCGQLRFVRR